MQLPEEIVKPAVTVAPETDLMEAARLMGAHGVGSLVVARGGKPVGLVTDRDVALHALLEERDPAACRVSDCMNAELVTLKRSAGTSDAVELLRRHGIRRLPVVDDQGRLAGIVTADDLVLVVQRELDDIAGAIRNELARERRGTGDGSAVFGKE